MNFHFLDVLLYVAADFLSALTQIVKNNTQLIKSISELLVEAVEFLETIDNLHDRLETLYDKHKKKKLPRNSWPKEK